MPNDVAAKILLVGTGGFLGANLRFWVGGFLMERLGPHFPWHTMIINVTGSLVIGFAMGMILGIGHLDNWRLFLVVGILGGYTTYSSFAYEAVSLLTLRQFGRALFYIEGTALLTVFAAWLGVVLSRVALGGRS